MIKFENIEVMNFEGAIRGMRNPLNSWDKSDSFICKESKPMTLAEIEAKCGKCPKDNNCDIYDTKDHFIIGKNDLDLAQRLIKAGSDHRKFLRQIFVTVDITAPLYWWKEFDTYKVGTVANSCSTMHTIHKKEFTRKDFSYERLFPGSIEILDSVIEMLNYSRSLYLDNKNPDIWYQMIQLLPTSYNQKRTVTLNYEVLRNIYGSRCNHKLDEWSEDFIEWIDSLPYAEELLKN